MNSEESREIANVSGQPSSGGDQEVTTTTSREKRLLAVGDQKTKPVVKITDVSTMFDSSDFQDGTESEFQTEKVSQEIVNMRHRVAMIVAASGVFTSLAILVGFCFGMGRGDELRSRVCTAVITLGSVCLAYTFRINLRDLAARIASALKE